MKVSDLIASTIYDLRNSGYSQWSSNELLDYLNRTVFQLDLVLQARDSDLIHTSTSLSLSQGENSVSLPSDFLSERSLWRDTYEIYKTSLDKIDELRQYYSSSTNPPTEYAISDSSIVFDFTADDDYTLTLYYNKKTGSLTTSDDMPYNDLFNGPIRSTIIMLSKVRYELDPTPDSVIFASLYDLVAGNIIRRKHIPRTGGRPYS